MEDGTICPRRSKHFCLLSTSYHLLVPNFHLPSSIFGPFHRLLYWNRLRAPGWPYFLRSFIRESRVSSPSAFNVGRRLPSTESSARAIPCRTAPAWPVGPPPRTVIRASYLPAVPVTVNGWMATTRSVSVGK